ncbi:MAG: hypothetical protein J5I92_15085 [Thiogranum sp.]|nr:hypothetical protein [Thiogranum sp.]
MNASNNLPRSLWELYNEIRLPDFQPELLISFSEVQGAAPVGMSDLAWAAEKHAMVVCGAFQGVTPKEFDESAWAMVSIAGALRHTPLLMYALSNSTLLALEHFLLALHAEAA